MVTRFCFRKEMQPPSLRDWIELNAFNKSSKLQQQLGWSLSELLTKKNGDRPHKTLATPYSFPAGFRYRSSILWAERPTAAAVAVPRAALSLVVTRTKYCVPVPRPICCSQSYVRQREGRAHPTTHHPLPTTNPSIPAKSAHPYW